MVSFFSMTDGEIPHLQNLPIAPLSHQADLARLPHVFRFQAGKVNTRRQFMASVTATVPHTFAFPGRQVAIE